MVPASNTDLHPLIRKLETIVDLSPGERRALAALPMTVRDLKGGQDLVRDQERPSYCCLIIEGFAFRYKVVEGRRVRPDLPPPAQGSGVGRTIRGASGFIPVMPHFYFDVTAGGVAAPDDEGVDLPSLDVARQEAMRTAAEMAKEHGGAAKEIAIAVRNGGRKPVATVRLSLTVEPA